jgi:hypothetical protein
MTLLVNECNDFFQPGFGTEVLTGVLPEHAESVIARDVFCPDGHHMMNQEWTISELRELMDTHAPVFHCEKHAYRWNPDVVELENLRKLVNAYDDGGMP